MQSAHHLVWIDLEMSGLNYEQDHILEIATMITNDALEILHPGISFVIHQPDSVLLTMNSWCKEQHAKSGLTEAVQRSTVTLEDAMEETLRFITAWCPPKTAVLCGNTVFQDRAFLKRWAPPIEAYLHYRIIDVSTVKELVKRWYPSDPASFFKKPEHHRALADIEASIAELRHYRTYFFK